MEVHVNLIIDILQIAFELEDLVALDLIEDRMGDKRFGPLSQWDVLDRKQVQFSGCRI